MQITNKYIKTAVSCLLILLALWVAFPKVFIHSALNHDHQHLSDNHQTEVAAASPADCEFEKYDKPVHFNIFRFISSFIPSRSPSQPPAGKRVFIFSAFSYGASLLRAPPAFL
jgi:hypothetical protein